MFSRNDSLKENVQKIQISVNKFPTPIEINNNDDNIHLFISIHPSTSQVMFTVKIFTCADDIPLGVFGGTCIELTLGGRPENKKNKQLRRPETVEVGCLRHPGATTIGNQLQDGDRTDGWPNLTTQP